MKTGWGWLADPYLHIVIAAVILLRLVTMGATSNPDGTADEMAAAITCEVCQGHHPEGRGDHQRPAEIPAPAAPSRR